MTDWRVGASILDEYTIEKELGRGGMGRVWLVRSQSTGRRFAVKEALIRDEKHRKAFLTELQTWIDLPEHPNIVPCRFFRTVGDEIVIFADYVDGGSLADWIAKGKLTSVEQILDVAIQFAWGLHAIHERGLIHQDVKPGNVLLTASGIPMVTDFGLARARLRADDGSFVSPAIHGGQHSISVPGAGLMTREYASPEQRGGKSLSRKTDVWSWGVSVLDMFVGGVSCPHGGHIAADVLDAFIENGQEDERLPELPQRIGAVLAKCFSRRPGERWADMEQISQALLDGHVLITGHEYQRQRPMVSAIDSLDTGRTRRASTGVTWEDPREWLRDAYEMVGRDPAVVSVEHPSATALSLRGQAIADLAIYREAQTLYEQVIAEGKWEGYPLLATVCVHMALVHMSLADTTGAISCYSKAEEIYERLIGKADLQHFLPDLFSAYMNKGIALTDIGDLPAAVELYDKCIMLHEHMSHEQSRSSANSLATAFVNKAVALHRLGDMAACMCLYDKALAIRERLVQEGHVELLNELAAIYANKAAVLDNLGDYDGAVSLYDRAIDIREQWVVRERHTEHAADLSATYISKARVLAACGEIRGASESADRAIALAERLVNSANTSDASELLARAHFGKGRLLLKCDHREQALDEFSLALCMFQQIVDMEGRSALLADIVLSESPIHEILTEASTSDVPAADRMYARHVERLRGVAERDARGESPCQLAALLSNWAGVKEAIGSFDEAASLLREAAAILEASLGEDSGERWRETLAVAYLNLGTAYHKMRDEGSAVDAWMTCVRRCMEWDAVQEGPPLLEPLGRGSVALAYHEARSGNYKGALARLGGVETAVRKWGGDNTPGIEAVLASVADLRGQIDAHRQHDRKLSPRMEAAVLADKALALREKGQVAEALEHYRRALDLDPDDADIWVNYGAACDAAGDDGVARQAFDKAVCLAPDNATAWHNKGAILFQQGRYEEALPALEKAYALGHQASMNAVARCRGMLRRLAREKGR